ncbi:MAG: DUF721 domain-containing protein [Flavobacteriales bacterium]|nr:DUF721 domain-containing protein [Flavobacteriales bacterium]
MSDGPLKPLINSILKAYGYQDQLDEIDIITAYEEIVGILCKKHTKKYSFKKNVFTIWIDSASLKQEMMYRKNDLMMKLNQKLGRSIINQIEIK